MLNLEVREGDERGRGGGEGEREDKTTLTRQLWQESQTATKSNRNTH